MPLTMDQLKATQPDLYTQIVNEGRAAAEASFNTSLQAKIAEAVEQQKPALIEEATKPVKADLDAARANETKTREALEGVKDALVALGVVNEKITDAEAKSRIVALEANVKGLNDQIAAKDAEIAKLTQSVQAFEAAAGRLGVMKQVAEAYKDSPHRALIVQIVGKQGFTDVNQAMESAKSIAASLQGAGLTPTTPAVPGVTPTTPTAPAQQPAQPDFLGIVNGALESLIQSHPGAGPQTTPTTPTTPTQPGAAPTPTPKTAHEAAIGVLTDPIFALT